MIRRILEQNYNSVDRESLQTITICEPGIKKEDVKRTNNFSKKHKVIILDGGNFNYKGQ